MSQLATSNLLAVFLLHLSAFDCFRAAIAAIVSAVFIVVFVITVAVSLVLRQLAGQFAFALVVRVDALALQSEYRVKMGGYGQTVNTHLA